MLALPVKAPVTSTVIEFGRLTVTAPADPLTDTSLSVPAILVTPVFAIVREFPASL